MSNGGALLLLNCNPAGLKMIYLEAGFWLASSRRRSSRATAVLHTK
jgi:hypothetical protein